jgi:hypothetical protein
MQRPGWMVTLVVVAALVASLPHATSALAQDTFEDVQAFEKKQRRLNIAGWTLVSAGIAFPLIATPIAAKRTSRDCEVLECLDYGFAVASWIVGPAMIISGTALLLKRRGLRKSHEAERELAIIPGLTGLTIQGTF